MEKNGIPVTKPAEVVRRSAYCMLDEVCITTLRRTSEANCVKASYFTRIMDNWNGVESANEMVGTMANGDTKEFLKFQLKNMSASMVLSNTNGTAPIEVDTFKAEAGFSGEVESTQSRKCRDCLELETEKFEPNTDFLKADVRLLTAGAAAGILWLAIMSG